MVSTVETMLPFVSAGKLTCILHALNNFAGKQNYERNIYPLPHTYEDFHRLFEEIPGNPVCRLVILPTHVFHIFSLMRVRLPAHMFAIREKHIYNYVAANDDRRHWWKVDSVYGVCEKIHTVQVGFGDAMILLALTPADEVALRNALIAWDCGGGRRNEYYVDARARLLAQLGVGGGMSGSPSTSAG